MAAQGPLPYQKDAHGAWRDCRAVNERQRPVPAPILDQVIDFTKNFVDVCHHGKEKEESLFPALGKGGMPMEGGPIASKDAP
jgi:hemerythrin-like domain-containing protein